MKPRIYRLNPRGVYVYGFWHYSIFWLLIFGAFVVVSILFKAIVGFVVFTFLAFLTAFCLVFKFVIRVKESKRCAALAVIAEGLCRKALLATLSANKLKSELKKIEVPGVHAIFSDDFLILKMQFLPGMPDVDSLSEVVSSGMRGPLKKFAVCQAVLSDDRTQIEFCLEKVGQNLAFTPKSLRDLVQKPYWFLLQDGLFIDFSKLPHLAVWGKSGTGKSTLLFSLIAQALSSGSELYFIDGKSEFSSLSTFYPAKKIGSDKDTIFSVLDQVLQIVEKRQVLLATETKKRQQFGLTAEDLGLQPVILFADEVGSVVSSLTSKEKNIFISGFTQIAQKGRSLGVFLVLSSQSPATDVIPTCVREQMNTKILLGGAKQEVQQMAFGEKVFDGGLPKFQGYFLNDAVSQPKKFYVPNFYKYSLLNLKTFEALYRIGKEK